MIMKRFAQVTVAALMLLLLISLQLELTGAQSASSRRLERAQQEQQQQQAESSQLEPAPEPYSFSYEAESSGGFATRQETGDSSGRVTGFYTIMGDDGRERRVDYIADDQGYRASVSTNEVGTRAESSADVQMNVRLPSAKQLEAAAISLEEYKFLEEVQTTERERQLERISQKQQQSSPAPLFKVSGGQAVQTGGRRFQETSATSTALTSGGANQKQQILIGQQQQRPQTLDRLSASSSLSLSSAPTPALVGNEADETNAAFQGASAAGSTAETDTENQDSSASPLLTSLSTSANQAESSRASESKAPFQRSQQQNQSSWRQQSTSSSSGWQEGRLGGTRAQQQQQPNVELRRQLEQQILQKAVQLTDQDYPRQTSTSAQVAGTATLTSARPTEQAAQQQQLANQGSSGVQTTWNNQQTNLANNAAQTTGAGQPNEYAQYNQQQSNIINEVGTQTDDAIQEDVQTPQPQLQSQPQPQRPLSVKQPTKSRVEFVTTTTSTTQSAPGGLVAINLNETSEQVGEQEVSRETERPQPTPWVSATKTKAAVPEQPSTVSFGQRISAHEVSMSSQQQKPRPPQPLPETSAPQQEQPQTEQPIEINAYEEPPRIPNSVNQIIESLRPTSETTFVDSGRQQQQQIDIVQTDRAVKTKQPQQSQSGMVMRTTISQSMRPQLTGTVNSSLQVQEVQKTATRQNDQPTTVTNVPTITTNIPTRRPVVQTTTTAFSDVVLSQPQKQQKEVKVSSGGVKGGVKGGVRDGIKIGSGSLLRAQFRRNRYRTI